MKRLAFLTLFVLLAVIIAACGNVVTPAPAPTTAPAAIVPPTIAPQVTAPTEMPTIAVQQPTMFEGLSSALDNEKQARIRAVSAVMGALNVDVYINGLPVVNGGKVQQDMGNGQFSGWVYVTPGTYAVALVPHGGTLDQALFAPMTVNAEAGHRYTVAAVGQLKESTVKPLVVDETALEASIGAKATDDVNIEINNLKGADSIDDTQDGKPLALNGKYGEAMIGVCNIDNPHDKTIVTGKPDAPLFDEVMSCQPASSWVVLYYGEFPGNVSSNDSGGTSELNTPDLLASFNDHHVVADSKDLLTFNTLLAAIDKAGMHDQFATGGPYFFFAPTDAAFAALPKDQLDALLADPQALTTLLKAHLVQGYYPFGVFSGATYGQSDAEVTNMLGQKLTLQGETLNGLQQLAGGGSYIVANSSRIQPINQLLPVN